MTLDNGLIDRLLRLAEGFLAQGHLAASEVVCHEVFDQDRDDTGQVPGATF